MKSDGLFSGLSEALTKKIKKQKCLGNVRRLSEARPIPEKPVSRATRRRWQQEWRDRLIHGQCRSTW